MVSYNKRKFTGPAFPVSNHEPQARSEVVSLVEARSLRFNSPFEVCVSHIRASPNGIFGAFLSSIGCGRVEFR